MFATWHTQGVITLLLRLLAALVSTSTCCSALPGWLLYLCTLHTFCTLLHMTVRTQYLGHAILAMHQLQVKGLHSKMLLSDAMKENDTQLEYKKQIEVLKKAQEAAFVEQQRQAIEVCGCGSKGGRVDGDVQVC